MLTFLSFSHPVLNPQYKTQYFKGKDWPEEWIDATLELSREEWRENYKPTPSPSSKGSAAPQRGQASTSGPGRRSANASTAAVSHAPLLMHL